MVRGICKFCGQEDSLQSSHLIPAGVFRQLLAPGKRNPHPATVSADRLITTSSQPKKHLLCSNCEELFNKRGERWTLAHMLRSDGGFPIADHIQKTQPLTEIATGIRIYPGPIGIEQAAYFAISVFWRAAVTTWPKHRGKLGIDIGPYERLLHAHLQDGADLPNTVAVGLQILTDPLIQTVVRLPQGGREGSAWTFGFQIPGLNFTLWLGRALEPGFRDNCLIKTGRIWVLPLAEAANLEQFKAELSKARP